jgi:endoglucanase
MGSLTDPENKLVYQMHQYLDVSALKTSYINNHISTNWLLQSDGSGTSATCVSATIGSERLVAATNWLRANKKVGLIGEFAGGVNAQCEAAITDMLKYMVRDQRVETKVMSKTPSWLEPFAL